MADQISDMLTRIRNAQMAGHEEAVFPFSKMKMAIAGILEKENFIEMTQKEKNGNLEFIRISLKYEKFSNTRKVPAIGGINKKSKSGQRIYLKKNEIRKVKNGYGISVLSTSHGVMTGKEARQKGLGGELICEVW